MMYRVNGSTYVPGKRILSWFYPLMGAAYNIFDARDMPISGRRKGCFEWGGAGRRR
jgi:hypothetical protein